MGGACCCRRGQALRDLVAQLEEENATLRDEATALQEQLLMAGGSETGVLNSMLEQMWPYLSSCALEAIARHVLPAMQSSMPAPLNRVTFDREGSGLGDKPVQLLGMCATKNSTLGAEGGYSENLVLRTRLSWDGEGGGCCISLTLAGMGLRICSVVIGGELLVELVGMVDQPAFFQGVRMYFANTPDIRIDFRAAASMLNAGLPTDTIRRKVQETIATKLSGALVLPNALGMKLMPQADFLTVARPNPEGLLRVTICAAAGLASVDSGAFFGASAPDAYVRLRCGAEVFQSPPQSRTTSPVFNFPLALLISCAAHQRLSIEVLSSRMLGTDDFLGRADVGIMSLLSHDPDSTCAVHLADEQGKRGSCGSVALRAEWRPLQPAGSDPTPGGGPTLISAGVYAATHIPYGEAGAHFSVVVKCTGVVGGEPAKPRQTSKLSAKSADKEDREAELKGLQRRLQILRRHSVPDEDAAEVLEVSAGRLSGLLEGTADVARGVHDVSWNQCFHFWVDSPAEAVVTFALRSVVPGAEARVLGSFSASIGELTACPSHSSMRTVQLEGTGIFLKVRLQMRFTGPPSRHLRPSQRPSVTTSKDVGHERSKGGDATASKTAKFHEGADRSHHPKLRRADGEAEGGCEGGAEMEWVIIDQGDPKDPAKTSNPKRGKESRRTKELTTQEKAAAYDDWATKQEEKKKRRREKRRKREEEEAKRLQQASAKPGPSSRKHKQSQPS